MLNLRPFQSKSRACASAALGVETGRNWNGRAEHANVCAAAFTKAEAMSALR